MQAFTPTTPCDSFWCGGTPGFRNVLVIYDLLDHARGTSEQQQTFGILDINLNPKLVYTYLKNFLAVLGDAGASYSPGTLGYRLSGATADVQSTLFEKRDGSRYLAVWIEKRRMHPDTKAAEPVAPQNVTLEAGCGKDPQRF